MSDSLQNLKVIPREILEDRVESVKTLKNTDHESYEVAKDRETGEHFLVYEYVHLNVAEGGHPENYYHLMPIEPDDVLGVILGEQPYGYPEHWRKPYMRNGANETYVWYDPSEILEVEDDEAYGEQVKNMLTAFKQGGSLDEASVKKLLDDVGRLNGKGSQD
jgi:hypothetical protein